MDQIRSWYSDAAPLSRNEAIRSLNDQLIATRGEPAIVYMSVQSLSQPKMLVALTISHVHYRLAP